MTWLDLPDGTLFGLDNLPYGVASVSGGPPRVVVGVGAEVLDVAAAADAAGSPELAAVFGAPTLDAHLAQGSAGWAVARERIRSWLTESRYADRVRPHLHPAGGARHRLPWTVADYVDFYSSEHHAANVGRLFRPGGDPLTPNWRHLPIGYHGRAGTVVVSGAPVLRPCGQRLAPGTGTPTFGPSERLDLEAEVGFVVGVPSSLGEPVPMERFAEHVFGVVLVNDWSARDIQAWEYVPLGPFLGKSFQTSVSPWVVPLAALEAARVPPPPRAAPLLPYLDDAGLPPWGLDLTLEVRLDGEVLSRPPFASMYWTAAQQLAHLTVNGASLRTGDLYASGTVSGPRPDEWGSLLELTRGGAEPLTLRDGRRRGFLEDGDEVAVTATAPAPGGGRIGFGAVTGRVLPPAQNA